MYRGYYEFIQHPDPSFPVIFHLNCFPAGNGGFIPHWHEDLELLFIESGQATFFVDGQPFSASAGNVIVAGFGRMHSMQEATADIQYYCLIVNPSLCTLCGFSPQQFRVSPHIQDKEVSGWLIRITEEFQQKRPYFQQSVKAAITSLLIYLMRNHSISDGSPDLVTDSKITMVKQAIRWMQIHYKQSISLSDLAVQVGFSRYYLCHVFREITGYPVSQYLNQLRCANARKLLSSGWTVSAAATACGFDNLSYFARIYKRCMGHTPSQDKRDALAADITITHGDIFPYS